VENSASCKQRFWLVSRGADFWLASGGASAALLAAMLAITLYGDRELDTLDFVLSEFHLGATYYTVLHRRLWRRLPVDVLLVPVLILALTYVLSMGGHTVVLTSIAMYAAIWHRGRQSLGVARFYQRAAGGPVSARHNCLFHGAIYLPMFAALLAYNHLAPLDYEGEPYFSLDLGAVVTSTVSAIAVAWLLIYLAWALSFNRGERLSMPRHRPIGIHPGEWWVVSAHAIAFGCAYMLGAAHASFLLVLAVYHEVQYLYFAYALSRRSGSDREASISASERAVSASYPDSRCAGEGAVRSELKHAALFLGWPAIGFGAAVAGGWFALEWLAPLGIGGLFCHYWLDGRIWTRRSLDA
jgi:hypothetical protein